MNETTVCLNKRKIGENIRLLIVNSEYTYDDVANYLNLTTSRVIYDWVNGFKLPKVEKLVYLSKLFQVTIEDILSI